MNLPFMLATLALSTCPALAQADAIQDLGTTSADLITLAFPNAISFNGSTIVGYTTDSAGLDRAFRWTEAAGLQGLIYPGATETFATFVSDDGSVVLGGSYNVGSIVWDAAGTSTLIAPATTLGTTAVDLSGDGSTVIGRSNVTSTQTEGFVWTATSGMQLVGQIGGTRCSPQSVSRDGQVVTGFATDSLGLVHVIRWTPSGGIQDTGVTTASGFRYLTVSGDGSTIAGYRYITNSSNSAFIWTAAGGYVDLGAPGTEFMSRLWLSDDGSVLMGNEGTGSRGRGFRWTASTGFSWLDTPGGSAFTIGGMNADGSGAVGVADSATMIQWTLGGGHEPFPFFGPSFATTQVRAMSGDGSAATGWTQNVLGQKRPVLWRMTGSTMGAVTCSATAANATGQTGKLSLLGSNAVLFGRLTMAARQLPPNAFGFFLASNTTANVVNPGGSAGTLCLGGFIGRFVGPGQIQQVDSSGTMALNVDPTLLPNPTGPVAPLYGERWTFQGWHRDAGPAGPTSNLTDAVSVRLY